MDVGAEGVGGGVRGERRPHRVICGGTCLCMLMEMQMGLQEPHGRRTASVSESRSLMGV